MYDRTHKASKEDKCPLMDTVLKEVEQKHDATMFKVAANPPEDINEKESKE
jgi:hypothetical protein